MVFILGIIPARGGSKSIPKKNIANLAGKPLIAYSIEASLKSNCLNDVILSTDSQIIADCAAQYGLITTSLRPLELATDRVGSIDVVIYELGNYERKYNLQVDIIVLLQPTAPMRLSIDIDDAIQLFSRSGADSLISVRDASSVHPTTMYFLEDNKLVSVINEGKVHTRRQEFKQVYVRNGALYIATREQIVKNKSFFCDNMAAYIMPRERSVNIDEPFDLELAEWMMSRHE